METNGGGAGDLAAQATRKIYDAYDDYQHEFKTITRRAKSRFEQRDWRGVQADALERLELYKKIIDRTITETRELLGAGAQDQALWARMKSEYSRRIGGCADFELVETFFNSVTRRIFNTVGVDRSIEFVDSDFEPLPSRPDQPVYHTYPHLGSTQALLEKLYTNYPFEAGYEDLERDIHRAAEEIDAYLIGHWGSAQFDRVEMIRAVFYRNNGAYLVGRLWRREKITPLVLCLAHPPGGVCTDAVLLDENEASIVFSFTRSYFHVDVDVPGELVSFLKSIIPLKRLAELYISIGYNKHGKTELYRDLLRHLANSDDKFEIARGERGMVMIVFTMRSYDFVFKVIKDRITPPKATSRREVMDRYDLVFKHDRAGRLVDAQEFEHISFERSRFSQELLDELLEVAPQGVEVDEACVVIHHLYTERRLTPLNLYVKEVDEERARRVVIDYGQAIKDLAATNIFPGDVLLKNFGVTRHGRVVFYDYDELTLLSSCKFRRMPQASSYDEELSAEPWFYVGPDDIFPEEFLTFLGLQEPLRSLFIDRHGDLFEVEFWRRMQARHAAGDVIDIFPYPENRRLESINRP